MKRKAKESIEGEVLKKMKKTDIKGKGKMVADKSKKWFGLHTRSSPYQLSECIKALRGNQKAAVRKMGFGRMLEMVVNGVPAKLGHYVVDHFNPKKMHIRVKHGKIKINRDVIHDLLGIPNGGIKIEELKKNKKRDEVIKQWRSRYPGLFVAPTRIVANIKEAEDVDDFNFRMDFCILFLIVMIESHKQGRLKEPLLNKITGDVKFEEWDWCGYVVKCLQSCKKKNGNQMITTAFLQGR